MKSSWRRLWWRLRRLADQDRIRLSTAGSPPDPRPGDRLEVDGRVFRLVHPADDARAFVAVDERRGSTMIVRVRARADEVYYRFEPEGREPFELPASTVLVYLPTSAGPSKA